MIFRNGTSREYWFRAGSTAIAKAGREVAELVVGESAPRDAPRLDRARPARQQDALARRSAPAARPSRRQSPGSRASDHRVGHQRLVRGCAMPHAANANAVGQRTA